MRSCESSNDEVEREGVELVIVKSKTKGNDGGQEDLG